MLSNIKDWLAGRKTYLIAAGAIIGVIVAWSTSEMTDLQAIEALVAAILAVTMRAGITKSK